MRHKHIAPKPYEIKCCAVQVKLEEKYLKEFDFAKDPSEVEVSEETKNHIFTPSKLAEKYDGYVGVTIQLPFIYVLFAFEKQDKALLFFNDIKDKYETKLVNNCVYADKRYLEGAFKGKLVTLPPDYVDEAIRELLNKYCYSVSTEEDWKLDMLHYIGNLGGREARITIIQGTKGIIVGLKNGDAYANENVCGAYKVMLKKLEDLIMEWADTHKGVAKIYA